MTVSKVNDDPVLDIFLPDKSNIKVTFIFLYHVHTTCVIKMIINLSS